MSCPIHYTCKYIDAVIDNIDCVINSLGQVESDDWDMTNEMADLKVAVRSMEDIRSDNDALRRWGEKMEDEKDRIEEELNNEIKEAGRKIESVRINENWEKLVNIAYETNHEAVQA